MRHQLRQGIYAFTFFGANAGGVEVQFDSGASIHMLPSPAQRTLYFAVTFASGANVVTSGQYTMARVSPLWDLADRNDHPIVAGLQNVEQVNSSRAGQASVSIESGSIVAAIIPINSTVWITGNRRITIKHGWATFSGFYELLIPYTLGYEVYLQTETNTQQAQATIGLHTNGNASND